MRERDPEADFDGAPDEDADLLRLVREAAGPALPAGAPARIRDGAWERAAALRRGGDAPRPGFRRAAWTVAAAAAVVAAIVLAGGAPPAFAVEGDPVRVWGGDSWRTERRAPARAWILVEGGGRRLVSPSGETSIEPGPGALFRILGGEGGGGGPWHVEVSRGGVGVAGRVGLLSAGEVSVIPDPGTSSFAGRLLLEEPAGASPVPPVAAEAGGDATVAVDRGFAVVRLGLTRDEIRLSGGESAAVLPLGRRLRLAPLRPWGPAVAGDVALGSPMTDAFPGPEGMLRILLRRPSGRSCAVDVPLDGMDEAVRALNAAMTVYAHRLRPTSTAFRRDEPLREHRHEIDGRSTVVFTGGGGPVILDRDGVREAFPDTAALRRARPEVTELFGDTLR
jgi:hypothetical protein